MEVILDKKNGGPYTIKDKAERRKEVHKLHFEKGIFCSKNCRNIEGQQKYNK